MSSGAGSSAIGVASSVGVAVVFASTSSLKPALQLRQ
jgi:hypothetical protein